MKVRRILQITWRGLVVVPLVMSSWAPGWAHPISEALAAAGVTPEIPAGSPSAQIPLSTSDVDGMPCHGMQAPVDAADNSRVTPEPSPVDDSAGCADHCCPAAHCAPAACISFGVAWIVTGVLNAPVMVNAETNADWRAPVPPRPPPVEQLRPPIA
jgi:hypothetical protein